jgi:hypothetical protein
MFDVRTGQHVRNVGDVTIHGFRGPFDVALVQGGVLVAGNGSHSVALVPGRDGAASPVVVTLGGPKGALNTPVAVAVVAPQQGPTLILVRESVGAAVQVFAVEDNRKP